MIVEVWPWFVIVIYHWMTNFPINDTNFLLEDNYQTKIYGMIVHCWMILNSITTKTGYSQIDTNINRAAQDNGISRKERGKK